jgi:adenosylcobinamide-GDP ribazoletransferase
MRQFLAAMRFLTVLPLPGTSGTAEADLARSTPFFAFVGLLLGAVAGAIAWGLSLVAPPLVASAMIVIVLLAFSGGLHMDGLSDTADGFLSARSRERILEIMKDSNIGAMGVIAVVGVMLVKFAALASLTQADLWRAAFLMPLAGRCSIVVEMAVLPYARPAGLGAVFCKPRPRVAAICAVAVLALAGWSVLGPHGLWIAGLSVITVLVCSAYCRRKIGGATGDTYGAGCEIVEIVPALTLAVWPLPT